MWFRAFRNCLSVSSLQTPSLIHISSPIRLGASFCVPVAHVSFLILALPSFGIAFFILPPLLDCSLGVGRDHGHFAHLSAVIPSVEPNKKIPQDCLLND